MTTRRDLFKFAGGAAVGALFTPAPWRLITDTALWSENWPGIPQPARGEIRAKFTHCALCPAGCAVRARCVGEQPVALAGVRGGLCPFGVTGHHLPYHPARLRRGPANEVANAIAKCGPGETLAVLDLRPGRTASWSYRRAIAAKANGVYLAAPRDEVSYDLAGVKTVVSLGVPLLDGWGAPATVFAARPGFRLIQVEAVESRTAALADWWLAVRPGSEEVVARAIAGEISVEEASANAGVPLAGVIDEIRKNGPAVVIGGAAAAAANRALGALGKTAVAQNEAPVPEAWRKAAAPVTELAAVPDHSIRVLLIDESAGGLIEWADIQKKLVQDKPLVATVACSRGGYARYAQAALPAAVYPEVTDDFPAPVDSVATSFRMATPLVKAPEGVVNPLELLGGISGDPLRERADAIHQAGKGMLTTYADGKTVPVKELSADDFWKALNAGGCWTGPDERRVPTAIGNTEQNAASSLPLLVAVEGGSNYALVSPLMSKVYQESNLRLAPNCVALHPAEARQYGLEQGSKALLETQYGRARVTVMLDSSVPPGVVQAGSQSLCGGVARAKVVRI